MGAAVVIGVFVRARVVDSMGYFMLVGREREFRTHSMFALKSSNTKLVSDINSRNREATGFLGGCSMHPSLIALM